MSWTRVVLGLAAVGWMAGVARAAAPGQSLAEARTHWAYQPVRRPAVPTVKAADRVGTPVDAFLLARLEEHGLGYRPEAERRVLLRRLTYDLVGLPPSAEEIRAFEADDSPDAVRRVVERLLASPRYGERWGRHWLDVARYADTKDLVLLYGRDALRPYAYTYRDYVVRAFNEDLPFREFIEDQLAADLVEPGREPWRLAGLGFLTLGRLFDLNPHDRIDDQIDTVTRGFLGLTVACARCHDHKYDAISAADYYGLYGVFASTEQPYALPLIEDPATVAGGREFEARFVRAQGELENHLDREFERQSAIARRRLGEYLMRAATTPPDLSETTQFALSLTPEDFRPSLVQRTRRFLEQRVRAEDPVFGPWWVLMALPPDTFAAGASAWQAERRASGPGTWNGRVVKALVAADLRRREDVPAVYAGLLAAWEAEWKQRTCSAAAQYLEPDERQLLEIVEGEGSPVWFPRRNTPDHMSRPEKDRYHALVLNLDKLAAHAAQAPPARAMVVQDLAEPQNPRVFVRGNPSRPGAPVPRGFLRVLNEGREQPFAAAGSGRLELARAIASPDNPLTARVLVNRVWMHHFGEPLVSSTTDFGARSEPPTHPELLDWLAAEFMASGWSLKQLHRVMVLSAAYQQGSGDDGPAARPAQAADPDNRWYWRYLRRRLDLEAMRDTLLHVAGRLDLTMGGRPVEVAADPQNRRRTVYGLVDRQNLPGLFRSFDFAAPDQCVERRPRTSVPQQALFAMNSPFVLEQARAVATLPGVQAAAAPEERVGAMFEQVLGRPATRAEVRQALTFLGGTTAGGAGLEGWTQLAQVLLVSNEAVFLE